MNGPPQGLLSLCLLVVLITQAYLAYLGAKTSEVRKEADFLITEIAVECVSEIRKLNRSAVYK